MPRRIGRFLKEVRLEMKKVTWPNRKEVSGATWVVIITVIAVAVFIFIIDTLLAQSLQLVFK